LLATLVLLVVLVLLLWIWHGLSSHDVSVISRRHQSPGQGLVPCRAKHASMVSGATDGGPA